MANRRSLRERNSAAIAHDTDVVPEPAPTTPEPTPAAPIETSPAPARNAPRTATAKKAAPAAGAGTDRIGIYLTQDEVDGA